MNGGIRIAMLAVLLLMVSGGTSAEAAFKRVKAAKGVKPAYVVRAEVRPTKVPVLRTLRLEGTGAGVIKWRCAGPCRRTGGPPEKITHPRRATVIRHLNVRMQRRTSLTIDVIVPSGQSRYLRIGARKRRVVVTKAGCVDGAGRRGRCAPPAVTVPDTPGSAPAAPLPAVPPAPQPEPTPVAPANNPDGRVERVTRVDQGHARVTGWASDADAASAAMTVRALVEGTPAAETSAGITRPAVGPHGFDFVVPVDDFRRTICILAVNLGGGSDTLLKGCDAVPEVGDFNDDGFISCDELNQLKANYGKSGSGLTGDLNNDGTVNIFDLSLMLSHFRPPPGAPTTC